MHPFKVVNDFEEAVASYTGAPYCVAVNSCTNALFLCLEWQKELDWRQIERTQDFTESKLSGFIEIPKKTYIGVAQSILNAGFNINFRDQQWCGHYQLKPYPIWDSAKYFAFMMYHGRFSDYEQIEGDKAEHTYVCTSHHWAKTLGIQQGGCIS